MIVAESQEAVGEAATQLGRLEPGRIIKDRSALDYIRVFVGKANMVGVPLAQLPLPAGFPVASAARPPLRHGHRPDAGPDAGVRRPGRRADAARPQGGIRKHFGDTIKATAEFSYVSLGLGMVLGVLLGLIPIPIPGVGTVTLGIGGGPLIVALIVGKLRRTGPLLWACRCPPTSCCAISGWRCSWPRSASMPGSRSCAPSRKPGFTMLFIGVAVLLTTVLIVLRSATT